MHTYTVFCMVGPVGEFKSKDPHDEYAIYDDSVNSYKRNRINRTEKPSTFVEKDNEFFLT